MKHISVVFRVGVFLILSLILINCGNPKLDENKINSATDEIEPVQINGEPRFMI